MRFEKLTVSRKLDLCPLITGSNIDLGSKNSPLIARTHREQSPVFFLLSSTTISFETRARGSYRPPSLHVCVMKIAVHGRGLKLDFSPSLIRIIAVVSSTDRLFKLNYGIRFGGHLELSDVKLFAEW